MKHCAGLDVSVKETAICIVDEVGKIVQEAKVSTEPEAITALLGAAGACKSLIAAGPRRRSSPWPDVSPSSCTGRG
jgi:predicted NBD/HSP70 family sugar kinase